MDDRILRIGDIETREKIYGPSNDRVEAWWAEFKNTPVLNEFDVFLVGAFAEKVFGTYIGITLDVDVVITGGDIKKEEELKFILDEGVRIGFKYNLLIDIFYNAFKYDIKTIKPYTAYRSWSVVFRQTANGSQNSTVFDGPEVTTLPSGLVRYDRKKNSGGTVKANKRFLSGEYIGVYINTEEAFDEDGKLKGKIIPDTRKSDKYKKWMASDARKEKLKNK